MKPSNPRTNGQVFYPLFSNKHLKKNQSYISLHCFKIKNCRAFQRRHLIPFCKRVGAGLAQFSEQTFERYNCVGKNVLDNNWSMTSRILDMARRYWSQSRSSTYQIWPKTLEIANCISISNWNDYLTQNRKSINYTFYSQMNQVLLLLANQSILCGFCTLQYTFIYTFELLQQIFSLIQCWSIWNWTFYTRSGCSWIAVNWESFKGKTGRNEIITVQSRNNRPESIEMSHCSGFCFSPLTFLYFLYWQYQNVVLLQVYKINFHYFQWVIHRFI